MPVEPVGGAQVPHRASRRAHPDRRIVVGRVGIAALRGHPAPDRYGVPFARQLVGGRQPQQMARRFGADGLAFVILAGQIRIAGHHLPARSQLTAGFQLEPLAAQLAAMFSSTTARPDLRMAKTAADTFNRPSYSSPFTPAS
ncbi:hypothetical protein G6F66_014576 [Rhizopus arrhizus]|nr:hypothetical protein G6F66_014576 [Rhizopus arrhizus]